MSLVRIIALALSAIIAADAQHDSCIDGSCEASVSLLQSAFDVVREERVKKNSEKAKPEKEKKEKPDVEPEPVPPVSCTMKCVTCLSLQFFAIYTALAVARTVRTFSGGTSKTAETILQGAVKTMNYAPMCAVLFLATRMRANLLTDNDPDKYNLPQPWAKQAMILTTTGVAVATILHLLTEIAKHSGQEIGMCAKVIDIVRYLTLPAIYVGSGTVTSGLLTMERPAELLKVSGEVPVSDAAYCVILLTVQYFVVHLGVQVGNTVDMWMKQAGQPVELVGKLSIALETAITTVYFCPMLAVLFMGADMRAHQLNPAGAPQAWASTWFYVTVYAVLGQTLVSVCVPLVVDAKITPGEMDGELVVEVDNKGLLTVLTAARWLLNAGLYIGMFVVVASIITIEAPEGEVTVPLSTTNKCVIMMTCQYFFIFFFLWMLLTLRDFGFTHLNFMLSIMTSAKETVMFAPMLSVLFVGTRVRALQLTNNTGAPQLWVQNCMYMASLSLLVQILMVIVTGLVTGKPASLEPDEKPGSGGSIIGMCTTVLQYLCMFSMYGGAVGVMYGLFDMTPENATAAAPGMA